jgi:DNA-directed RNA polymerase alpha subunit
MNERSLVSRWPVLEIEGRLKPVAELRNGIRITDVLIPTIIINSLARAGIKTIGQVRKSSDRDLRRIRGIGPHALRYLRASFGEGSTFDE